MMKVHKEVIAKYYIYGSWINVWACREGENPKDPDHIYYDLYDEKSGVRFNQDPWFDCGHGVPSYAEIKKFVAWLRKNH